MSQNEFDLEKYESKQDRESELLEEFERACIPYLENIREAKANMILIVQSYKIAYGVDFTDEYEDMVKDA